MDSNLNSYFSKCFVARTRFFVVIMAQHYVGVKKYILFSSLIMTTQKQNQNILLSLEGAICVSTKI